ncbi:uncharacterized protein PSFLO_03690 [Pseudozyma flocculosa]|uniref:Uncharacterized protein n=1 Tax=Pseudozyma flocculosa TaxID=84751 RepID=A0A5C3F133_9BASI|nr:uncharacterized protein PSFLO_03690 [Pseudozyma flocculosa]
MPGIGLARMPFQSRDKQARCGALVSANYTLRGGKWCLTQRAAWRVAGQAVPLGARMSRQAGRARQGGSTHVRHPDSRRGLTVRRAAVNVDLGQADAEQTIQLIEGAGGEKSADPSPTRRGSRLSAFARCPLGPPHCRLLEEEGGDWRDGDGEESKVAGGGSVDRRRKMRRTLEMTAQLRGGPTWSPYETGAAAERKLSISRTCEARSCRRIDGAEKRRGF